jgi:molecular chaperone HscB
LSSNHFDLLGLPARFTLDAEELERNYLARSRALHPDYHQTSGAAAQHLSLQMSAQLNEAHLTLSDVFRRAEYLLTLQGGPTAAEHKAMDPAFLQDMLDLRMQMQELLGDSDPLSPARIAMEQDLRRRRDELEQNLKEEFTRLEGVPPSSEARRAALLAIRQVLNSAKYVQGLLRDLTEA